jgi:putative peptidoglycan lipid II flippase
VTGPAVPRGIRGSPSAASTQTPGGDDQETSPPAGSAGIGRAAALIAALTVLARLLGLVRTVVFAQTVGAGCLGTAYTTANLVPNIIYDIVLGGALTAIVVPVLARPAQRAGQADTAEVRQTSSALLTWAMLILVPVSAAIALAAGPLATVLNPHNGHARCSTYQHSLVVVTGHMLAVFAPQILLYGLAVVLYGILQAHRRFAAPALAPVISSLVVITAYLAFVPLGGGYKTRNNLAGLPVSAELMLSVGTTAGVAALVLTALVPAWRLRISVRPALRFPSGVGRRLAGLAGYGVAAVLAQDLSSIVVVLLANGHGATGSLVLYGYGWQFFEAAYAVLAISVAVSAFPVLSVRGGAEFDGTAASSARGVLLACFAGTAALIAVAYPAAQFLHLRAYPGQVAQLTAGFVLFAPGLAGYGLVACQSRALLAAGHAWTAAVIVAGGWLVVIAADVVLVSGATSVSVVAMLALGNTIGLTAAGAALMVAVRRIRGRAALDGTLRAAAAGLVAAAAGAAAGTAVAVILPSAGRVQEALVAVLAALCALAAFGMAAMILDGGELRAAIGKVRRGVLR